jgi:CheY-like chemotaxis protein
VAVTDSFHLPPNFAALRVLVVEDNEDAAISTAMILRQHGHTVVMAADGLSALEKVRAEPPDVVLLDIGLPKLDGYAVADQINRLPKPPLIIAITAHGSAADYRRSAEVGIPFHFVKPLHPDLLVKVVKSYGDGMAQSRKSLDVMPKGPEPSE